MKRNSSSLEREKGAATLFITIAILFAMSLAYVAIIKTNIVDTKMLGNERRSKEALQNAQAGVDYLLAGLARVDIDRGYLCSATTRNDYGFQLEFPGETCVDVPFEILTKIENVRSWGYSRDGESVRIIETTIDLTTPWNTSPPSGTQPNNPDATSLVSMGNVTLGGTPETALCNVGAGLPTQCTSLATQGNVSGIIDGTLIRAKGSITSDGNIPMGSENLSANDATLAPLTNDDLFTQFATGGESKADFINNAYEYVDSSNDADVVTTSAGNNQRIYVDGDITLRNGTLGTPERPVILYVDGALNLAGNVIIWGVVYAVSAEFSAGTNKILGTLISEGDVDMKGNAAVYYNGSLRPNLQGVDPDSLTSEIESRLSSVRIGSWRELSLPRVAD